MNEQETSHYAIQAVLRAATREDFESKIGKLTISGRSIYTVNSGCQITVTVKGREVIIRGLSNSGQY